MDYKIKKICFVTSSIGLLLSCFALKLIPVLIFFVLTCLFGLGLENSANKTANFKRCVVCGDRLTKEDFEEGVTDTCRRCSLEDAGIAMIFDKKTEEELDRL